MKAAKKYLAHIFHKWRDRRKKGEGKRAKVGEARTVKWREGATRVVKLLQGSNFFIHNSLCSQALSLQDANSSPSTDGSA